MRIGRSLLPGKVFFERGGVLSRVTIGALEGVRKNVKKTGFTRIRDGIFQWGVSDSIAVVDFITFPIPFTSIPEIQVSIQGSRVEITNITTTGFQLRTRVDSVPWTAFGR